MTSGLTTGSTDKCECFDIIQDHVLLLFVLLSIDKDLMEMVMYVWVPIPTC